MYAVCICGASRDNNGEREKEGRGRRWRRRRGSQIRTVAMYLSLELPDEEVGLA